MKLRQLSVIIALSFMFLLLSCGGDKQSKQKEEPRSQSPQAVDTTSTSAQTQPPLPMPERHYVYDSPSHTIYEITLSNNQVSNRFVVDKRLVAIAYDAVTDLVYQVYGKPGPKLTIYDLNKNTQVGSFDFPEIPSDMLFDPVKRQLFIISEDSTHVKTFACDSSKFVYDVKIHIMSRGHVGPIRVGPGPRGMIITANGARAGVTRIFTNDRYMNQTVVLHNASYIDYAAFAFDGNSFYCCASNEGRLMKVAFGTGEIVSELQELDNPRFVQLEVSSNTVVVITGKTGVLMLHADTFREMGRVDLSDYGDNIISLQIPPKANFAEIVMEYKGVRRWLRFDISNWEATRLVELI